MSSPVNSFRFVLVALLAVTGLFPREASSQTWTFRNGFGQSGATNSLADVGRGVCSDASGNVYVTGKISDDLTGNTVSFGGAALVSAGDDDGFVAKFNSSGVHQWSLRFGGTSIDIGNGIATDGTSVYVTGSANGAMTVGTSATSYPVASAGIDGVIMKLDAATGSVAWVTRFGGGNSDEGQALCLDPSGNVYVSGFFRTRTANPTAVFGAFTRTVQGNFASYSSDLFVAQLNPTTGAFNWVSTGGDAGGNDNIQGSGICYVPSLAEVVVTGSYRSLTTIPGSTTATYSTTSPVSSVTLTNSNVTTNEEFCLLELSASTGAFVSGSGVGSGDGNELGLGITYDSSTGDVFFAGSFSSASVTFPGLSANTNPSSTRDNILYGRYNPATNSYIWVKDANNSASASAADVARAIASDGTGSVFITGNFRNTVTFPNAASGVALTASGALSDIFMTRIDVGNGNALYAAQGTGTSANADDIGYGLTTAPGRNLWMTGQYATNLTLSPLAALASAGGKEDIVLAKFNDPPPPAFSSVNATTFTVGTNGNFSVTATGTPNPGITLMSGALPGGVNFTPGTGSGTLSGTPNAGTGGTYSLTFKADSGATGSVTQSFTLTVNQAPAITSANTATFTVGSAGNFQLTASGFPTSLTFSNTGNALPGGVTLSSSGLLSGNPGAGTGGVYNLTFQASNGVAPAASQSFTLRVVTSAPNYLASFGLSGGNAALNFDFDHDGVLNLMEYALGMNPAVSNQTGLPVVILKDYSGTTYLSMTFTRSSAATDITYVVQGGSDLSGWTDLATSAAGGAMTGATVILDTPSGLSHFNVEVRDNVSFVPANPHRYLRLKVTSP